MMLEVLVLGTLISESQERLFINKGIKPEPANIVQKCIIDGLIQNETVNNIQAIGAPRIPTYPRKDVYRLEQSDWKFKTVSVHTVGFLNLPGIWFLNRETKTLEAVKHWTGSYSANRKILLVYSMNSTFLKAAKEAKK